MYQPLVSHGEFFGGKACFFPSEFAIKVVIWLDLREIFVSLFFFWGGGVCQWSSLVMMSKSKLGFLVQTQFRTSCFFKRILSWCLLVKTYGPVRQQLFTIDQPRLASNCCPRILINQWYAHYLGCDCLLLAILCASKPTKNQRCKDRFCHEQSLFSCWLFNPPSYVISRLLL